jgi:hypothetical protein
VDTLSKFLRRADKSVWVGHELPADATKSDPICELAMNSRHYKVDFFFTAQSLLQSVNSFVLKNMEVIFRVRLFDAFISTQTVK